MYRLARPFRLEGLEEMKAYPTPVHDNAYFDWFKKAFAYPALLLSSSSTSSCKVGDDGVVMDETMTWNELSTYRVSGSALTVA
ncbi:hypothetical protein VTH06DRAFT_3094 [Thermothelomyces fergusii]